MSIDDIAKYKWGKDREILSGGIVHPDDRWFVDEHDTYTWYRAVAIKFQPRRIAELGVRYGYSAIALIRGARPDSFVGIDGEADGVISNSTALKNITDSRNTTDVTRLTRVTIHAFNTRAQFHAVIAAIGLCDMIHVDADHSPEGILLELDIARQVCDGTILVDDCDVPHILDAARRLASSKSAEFLILPTQHQLGVIMLPNQRGKFNV